MSGLVIDGAEYRVPNVNVESFLGNPKLARGAEDGRARRTRWVRMQINHTTKGIPGGRNRTPQVLRPGAGPDAGRDERVASFWTNSPRQSGAHTIIDTDGSIGQVADLLTVAMYHAGAVNEFSVGHEIFQDSDASIWEASLRSCVAMNVAICQLMGIQLQIHRPYQGPIRRLREGGKDCVGIFGHHDVTSNRGPGDPGELIKDFLVDAGAEVFDFSAGEDRAAWSERQRELGVVDDGVPGPQTVAALREAGYRDGIWALGKGDSGTTFDVKHILCRALGCGD